MDKKVSQTLDHLFRRQSGQLVAYLTRFFGPDHLDLSETVVQEALLRASQSWPLQGIPDNPEAWILRAAKNAAIDLIRKKKEVLLEQDDLNQLTDNLEGTSLGAFDEELADDKLKLLFVCCHPSLSKESQIALTLKTVCGFSVKEIARAFLAKEETIAQRLVRAKHKITEEKIRYEIPEGSDLEDRISSVLEVIYLLFNEGYLATDGESLLRQDLCEEAIYQLNILICHPLGQKPNCYALLSLMFFQISRFQTRVDNAGEIILLEDQDRSLWNQEQIALGLHFLNLSANGEQISDYHLHAGIASCHALAPDFKSTNWDQILSYYDLLLARTGSPVVALNRTVAIGMCKGFEKGISEAMMIKESGQLKNYYLLPATIAEFHHRTGQYESAIKYYEEAGSLAGTAPEKRLIEKRIQSCLIRN
jgi:RNA polymerase sigma factor (sigma-70 family)